jgi:hypothetical protein
MLVYQHTSMANQTFFVTFMNFEFGIEILVYMYDLHVSAYGMFDEICRTKKLWEVICRHGDLASMS